MLIHPRKFYKSMFSIRPIAISFNLVLIVVAREAKINYEHNLLNKNLDSLSLDKQHKA